MITFFSSILFGCLLVNYELKKPEYTFEDLYTILKVPLTSSSNLFNSPDPMIPSFYYFIKSVGEGHEFTIGDVYKLDHEYRFDNGQSGIRYFRDSKFQIQIVCSYENSILLQGAWLDGILSELTDNIILDTVTNNVGFVVFEYERYDPNYKTRYLLAGKTKDGCFYADISKNIIKKSIKETYKSIDELSENAWNKYIRFKDKGEHLPESGPGQGVKPSEGDVINGYEL